MKKTGSRRHENPEMEVSFARQNRQLDAQQNRLNVEILRVHTIEKQRAIMTVWNCNQQQLCAYFTDYDLFPQDNFSFTDLLNASNLKLIKSDGKIFFGQIDKKKRHGKGVNVYRQGKVYEGSFVNNQKTGHGVQIYANGNLYIGQFLNNKKHGKGSFFWFNLSSKNPKADENVEYYEGDWWGGLPDGEGIHQKVNGDMYTGIFKNGLKHGEGSEYFGNGDFYKGEYVNGLPEGYGEYSWQDGSFYKGDFKQGLRNGYGVWHLSKHTTESYKGHYSMDKKSGYGVYTWENGWIYKGNFDHDIRNGFGELYQGKEIVYKGFWENGEQTQREINNQSNQINMRSTQLLKSQRNSRIREKQHRYDEDNKSRTSYIGSSSKHNRNYDQFNRHEIPEFNMNKRPQSYSGINKIRQPSKTTRRDTREGQGKKLNFMTMMSDGKNNFYVPAALKTSRKY